MRAGIHNKKIVHNRITCNTRGMTESPAAARLDTMLCFAVYSLRRDFDHAYREILRPYGLSYTQYVVLVALLHESGLTVGRLGELLGLDSGTLSPLLKRLEGRGLIERRREPDDERIVHVELTDAGEALRADLEDVPRCFGQRLGISRRQADALIAQAHGLSEHLKEGTPA